MNFRANGAAIANLEDHHYYPFGMKMEGIGSSTVTNKYTYNYKELNEDFGLNWHDYGARWCDAALGRWWSVDPLGEKTPRWSVYNYGFDNPLRFVDPTGMASEAYSVLYKTEEYTQKYYENKQEFMSKTGGKEGEGGGNEQNPVSEYQNYANQINADDPNIHAKIALRDDVRVVDHFGDARTKDPESKLTQDGKQFAKAVKNEIAKYAPGIVHFWIDPNLYKDSEIIESSKLPSILKNASNQSGVPITRGMFNAYNRVIDVFKSEGISLGSRNKNAPEFYIWIMPLNQQGTHNVVSEVSQDIKHNSLIWAPSLP